MTDELKMLYQVARMYYEDNLTQGQIASELEINRVTVSRMLKKIREKGIVQIHINYDAYQNSGLALKLKEAYQLQDVVIVPDWPGQSEENQLKELGQAGAKYLAERVKPEDIVGFSWGTALAATVEALDSSTSLENVMCVPLIGGPDGEMESRYHANSIVYDAARKWKGFSKLIDVPAIVESADIRKSLTASAHFKEIEDLWERLSIAVVGIGSPLISDGTNWRAFYGPAFEGKGTKPEVAGDICSNFYTFSGEVLHTELSKRTISVSMQHLQQAECTIGVAHSLRKKEAIRVALEAGFLDVLVTTEQTAKELMKVQETERRDSK
ncbi:sugar-binding transcriptional regulator [Planococcus maritimus]|uniref:sugar-binding transcriptional regulator n=1 Tax=Planococcus maritimus TaxID=192421 RepID=UPI000AA869B9|nr:sugar-binding transcriptional regulator [Planococcus maritimus]